MADGCPLRSKFLDPPLRGRGWPSVRGGKRGLGPLGKGKERPAGEGKGEGLRPSGEGAGLQSAGEEGLITVGGDFSQTTLRI